MNAKRIPLPPRLGGGDVIMRETTAGEHEDILRAAGDTAWVDRQSEMTMMAIVQFRGKALSERRVEREAWWRGLSSALRDVLIGYSRRVNSSTDKEIDDFFAAAEPEPA